LLAKGEPHSFLSVLLQGVRYRRDGQSAENEDFEGNVYAPHPKAQSPKASLNASDS
jgi:hypothetical protein